MKFKLSKLNILFFMIMIFSTLMTISSTSWLNMWMGMEINLMSFIPIMMNKSKMKISNSMMIYFIIQASTSSLMLMMIILKNLQINLIKVNLIINIIQISLMMKLGSAPLHWWMPKMMINLNWMNCLLMLTWQKIGPLMMLINFNNNSITYMMSLISVYMGAMLMMNQTSLKLILTYSSINHLGWMLMLMNINMKMMKLYFIIYSMITFSICMVMNNFNMNFINQLFYNNNQNLQMKMIYNSLFLSLSGLPPLLGFMPKMLTLIIMIKNSLIFESTMFVIMATISISIYIKPCMSMMLLIKNNNKWNNINSNKIITSTSMKIITTNMLLNMIIYSTSMDNLF